MRNHYLALLCLHFASPHGYCVSHRPLGDCLKFQSLLLSHSRPVVLFPRFVARILLAGLLLSCQVDLKNVRAVKKDLLPILTRDETEPSVAHKFLNLSFHLKSPPMTLVKLGDDSLIWRKKSCCDVISYVRRRSEWFPAFPN